MENLNFRSKFSVGLG